VTPEEPAPQESPPEEGDGGYGDNPL
jgi:hypothetical protein